MKISSSALSTGTAATLAALGVLGPSLQRAAAQIVVQPSPQGRNDQYALNGLIIGRVTWDDGKPAIGVLVQAHFTRMATGRQGDGKAITDAQGNYQIRGLAQTDFRVMVANDGKPYIPDPAQIVDLKQLPGRTAGNVTFTIHKGPEITVRVHDAQTGAPLAGIPVLANRNFYGSQTHMGITDANGELRFRSGQLKTQVSLDRARVNGQEVEDAPGYSRYRVVEFTRIKGIHDVVLDFRTYSGAPKSNEVTFHGVVTGPDGRPVAGADVRMSRQGTSIAYQARTDVNGAFSFSTYRMQTSEFRPDIRFGRVNKGILLRAEKDGMMAIHYATPDETWSSIPIRLSAEHKASVSGQVVDPAGKPTAGVHVSYLEQFARASGAFQKNCGVTDASGRFKVTGLSPDGYYWFTFGGHHLYQTPAPDYGLTHVPDRANAKWGISLRDGEQHDLGKTTVWPSDASIAGHLTGDGAKNGLLLVVVRGPHTDMSCQPNKDGSFEISPVVREPLTLAVYRSSNGSGWGYDFDKPGSRGEVARQSVRAGDSAVVVTVAVR